MKIKTGRINKLARDDLKPARSKARVTMWLDLDVLDAARALASGNEGYQTVINRTLRAALLKERTIEQRLRLLESTILRSDELETLYRSELEALTASEPGLSRPRKRA